MAVTIPPVDSAPGTDAPVSPDLPITAFRARQLVNVLTKMEVSSQMSAGTPTLVGAGPHKLAPLIVQAGLASSNSEAIRKIKEGAVSLDGEKTSDFQRDYAFDRPIVVKLGRKYARLTP